MKKWMICILIVITAAGTFTPCCIDDNCCAEQQSSNAKGHDEHQPEGACSPFFSCAACPGFIEVAKPFQLTVFLVEKNILYKNMPGFNLPAYSTSFWQPPRACWFLF